MTTATARTLLAPGLVGTTGVHAYVGGAGPTLVLLHGLGGSAANWMEVVARLRGRRVVAIDLPGHGGSPAPPREAGVATFADAVAAAIERTCETPALVAGHSFGGHVALRLALRRPDLVRGLLLVCPAGVSTGSRAARQFVAVTTRLRPIRAVQPLVRRFRGHSRFRRAVLRPWFVADGEALSDQALGALLRDVRVHDDLRPAGLAMTRDDLRPELAGVDCPSLVLWGARDLQLPLEDGIELARRLRAPLRVVADCGHLLIVERPDAVIDALGSLDP